jgi:hypothetical protein
MGILGGSSDLPPGALGPYEPYRNAIIAASKATGVKATILAGMCATESRGHYGDLTNPLQADNASSDMTQSMINGAKMLVDYANQVTAKYGNPSLGLFLRAYNSGPNGVDPSNLSNLAAGLGQPYYVDQVTSDIKLIEAGQGDQLPK